MITLHRFVGLIETHSNELASHLLDRIRNSEGTPDYHLVPDEDLREVVYEIYRHLGDWLMTRNEFDLAQRFQGIGARRAKHVSFSVEVFDELEMLELLYLFFDRAIYYAASGYEKACTEMQIHSLRPSV